MLPVGGGGEVTDYKKVWAAVLNMVNLSMEAYRRRRHNIEFGPDCHPHLTDQRIGCMYVLAPSDHVNSGTDSGGCDGQTLYHYSAI